MVPGGDIPSELKVLTFANIVLKFLEKLHINKKVIFSDILVQNGYFYQNMSYRPYIPLIGYYRVHIYGL